MKEYQELLKMLKVATINMQTLHRHLVGSNWFGDHKQLGEYYEHLQEDLDKFCELGLAIGVEEPTMKTSLEEYDELEIKDRDCKESYTITKDLFNNIVAQINRISGLQNDVINALQEAQTYYRVEASYKLERALID